jgi:hypothetical protein
MVRALEPQDRAVVAAFHRQHAVSQAAKSEWRATSTTDQRVSAFDEGELIRYFFWVNNRSSATQTSHLRILDIR